MITTQPMTDDVRAWVIRGWINSALRRETGSPEEQITLLKREAVIRRLAAEQRVIVAHDDELPEGRDAVGWVCFTPLLTTAVVHYVYVREPRRGSGIARQLAAAAAVDLARPIPYTMSGPMRAQLGQRFNIHHMRPEDMP